MSFNFKLFLFNTSVKNLSQLFVLFSIISFSSVLTKSMILFLFISFVKNFKNGDKSIFLFLLKYSYNKLN